MKAKHTKSKTTKGWAKRAPSLISERKTLKKRCGSKAFLEPNKFKYPIVAKGRGCAVDCGGVLTALRRAKQFHHPKIARKAARIGKRINCLWA